ncbi:MAG: HAD-IB family phosphatase [Thermodesulfobacteriota bacterium]
MPPAKTPRVVFSDFDGTITGHETLVGMFQKLCPGDVEETMRRMVEKKLSLREGVAHLASCLTPSHVPEIRAYARNAGLRPGFSELLDFLDENKVPFVLISGGLLPMVEEALGPLLPRCAAVHALGLSENGGRLSLFSRFATDGEWMDKAAVMELYPCDQAVAIGDGITDFAMAEKADLVFATSMLASRMKKQGRPYFYFSDFFTVRDTLSRLWTEQAADVRPVEP